MASLRRQRTDTSDELVEKDMGRRQIYLPSRRRNSFETAVSPRTVRMSRRPKTAQPFRARTISLLIHTRLHCQRTMAVPDYLQLFRGEARVGLGEGYRDFLAALSLSGFVEPLQTAIFVCQYQCSF